MGMRPRDAAIIELGMRQREPSKNDDIDQVLEEAGGHEACKERTVQHAARWHCLFMWWVTHALVGGTVRVVFEAELIAMTKSKRFSFSQADIGWFLQAGTISCVTGKLLCGPIVAWIGVTRTGWISLLLCGASVVGVALPADGEKPAPLVSVLVAWCSMRCFQTATWPATNQLLFSWFPKSEHGRAWGIMSTASRIGIIVLTLCISLRDRWWDLEAKDDRGDAVQSTFFAVGIVMW